MQNEIHCRLCYVGSLRVEATSAGMILLYRLLETYPPERLRVIHVQEDDRLPNRPDRRIVGVRYFELLPSFRRGWFFARTRVPWLFWIMLEVHAWWKARQAARLIAPFRPEAVLTIHEQFGWLTAGKLAKRLGVPLHLILHDDWFRNLPMASSLTKRFDAAIGRTYRSAGSRLCVSPYMEEEYARRYGARGTVLYPSRSRAGQFHPPSIEHSERTKHPLKIAYGGNIFHQGYWDALRDLATVLDTMGGQLLIFGPSKSEVAQNGLDRPNVIAFGFVENMIMQIREKADVLFLPMTFEAREKSNMRLSFPSKLVEYTATGRPILIYGPEYCSAVRWARDNPGSAEIVSVEGCEGLSAALNALSEPVHRQRLALRAFELGVRYFSFDSAMETFLTAIQPGQPAVNLLPSAPLAGTSGSGVSNSSAKLRAPN